ncbi:MAG: hypothetical protein GY724_03910 [Actinomycetia bacterium]|nr:hypothetical protein [Actinomycetes bacterium]MCP5034399.1 hypothetical protein [Actinomycetes bacterium]
MASIGLAIVGIFLTWIEPAGTEAVGSARIGIEEGDGVMALVVGVIGLGAAFIGARPAWIAVGFGTAIAVRDAVRVNDNPAADIGLGLWITAIGFAIATVLLLADLTRTIMASRPEATPN